MVSAKKDGAKTKKGAALNTRNKDGGSQAEHHGTVILSKRQSKGFLLEIPTTIQRQVIPQKPELQLTK